MRKTRFFIVTWFVLWLLSTNFFIDSCNADSWSQNIETQMIIDIDAWPLTIWISGSKIILNWTWWEFVTWKFDWMFWVDDQNWSAKYWTTISATDLVFESWDTKKIISGENIKIKRWNNTPTLIDWYWANLNNEIKINPILGDWTPLNKPVKYFTYNEWNTPNWILWKYWDSPEISIDLTNWDFSWCTSNFPCTFKWTLTYTLYEIE